MKLVLLWVAGQKEVYADVATDELSRKIGHILEIQMLPLKARRFDRANAEEKTRVESEIILASLKATDYVVLFSEEGQLAKSSREWSQWIVRGIESGKSRLVFIIGGPFGVNENVRSRANLKLSLSPLTMNHHVARIVALEQIYRALSIWRNLPYHND